MTKLEQAARQVIHKINQATALDEESDELLMEAITALREALAEQAEQEPLLKHRTGDCLMCGHCSVTGEPLYAAPVQQVDLSDDEICKANKTELPDCQDLVDFARAVIAADREKNNANNNT